MNLWSAALDLLFPPKCPFCQSLLEDDERLLCARCQKELPWAQGKSGERDGEFFEVCIAPLHYRGRVRESVHRYKFSGVRACAVPFATLMAQCVTDRLEGGFDCVSWVPLSRKRLRSRGYDQARLLARGVAAQLGLEAVPLLDKVRHTPAQSGLEEESARRANVLGAYSTCSGADVKGKRILLVDDVVTTGATLSECARILLSAGAEQVVCVTLALAGRGKEG